MMINDHRLCDDEGKPVPFRETPNHGGAIVPEYLVMHYTAGASAEGSIAWLTDERARASAHLVVARDGSVTQLLPFNLRAWHAGPSQWRSRSGLNGWSIGIELDNAGELTGGASDWRTAWDRRVPDEHVLEATHANGGPRSGWHRYTAPQLEAATQVAALLVLEYRLKDVLGHDQIAPERKRDPGPAFPMQSFRAAAFGRADDEETPLLGRTTTALNIRTGPGTRFEKLSASPLPRGTDLEVLDSSAAWHRVFVLAEIRGDMDIEGWVHGRYVDLSA